MIFFFAKKKKSHHTRVARVMRLVYIYIYDITRDLTSTRKHSKSPNKGGFKNSLQVKVRFSNFFFSF